MGQVSRYGDRPSSMKKPPPEKLDEMEAFQQDISHLTEKYRRSDDPSMLFMCCGVMLKTCMEMYLSVLNDEAIERVPVSYTHLTLPTIYSV